MDATVNTDSPPVPDLAAAFGQLVRARRSTYSYADRDVPRALVEAAVSNAVLAPNHHRTGPWRFFVVPLQSRGRLVAAYEAAARRTGRDVARAAQRAQDAPVNVVVACVPCVSNPKVSVAEEEFATAAAVQNFLLSLAASGVDSLLTTGELAQSPEVARLVALEGEGARLMGVINVGYRNPQRPLAPRADLPISRVVRWIGPDTASPTTEDAT